MRPNRAPEKDHPTYRHPSYRGIHERVPDLKDIPDTIARDLDPGITEFISMGDRISRAVAPAQTMVKVEIASDILEVPSTLAVESILAAGAFLWFRTARCQVPKWNFRLDRTINRTAREAVMPHASRSG